MSNCSTYPMEGDSQAAAFTPQQGTDFCKWCRVKVDGYICWYPERSIHHHLCWKCFNDKYPEIMADNMMDLLE